MATQQALLGAADFAVFERSSAQLVSTSFPFSRVQLVIGISGPDMLITMAVKTGYSDNAKAAKVMLNGKEVGRVDPRPWTNHFVIDMETVTFVVPQSAVPTGDAILHLALLTLQIVPTNSDPDNFLLVGPVVCHYHKIGATLP
jgi:hypothetical protein